MYKLIAIDIDGTLLDSDGEISKKNKEAISKAIKNGIEVVLASGRTITSIKTLAAEVGANNYLIAGNGALVYDIQANKVIYNNYIKKEKVLEIIKICEENNIFYTVSNESKIVTKEINYDVLFYTSENLKNSEDKQIDIKLVKNIYDYVEKYTGNDFLKITICNSDKERFLQIVEKIKQIKKIDLLECFHSSKKNIKIGNKEEQIEYYYTEITNKNVDKWSAIRFLANKLNIGYEEIISIGDNVNDLEMIKNAGLGVAMENGLSQVKDEANIITKSNDNSGIAHVINKYLN